MKKYLFIFIIISLLSSCGESFLNVKPQGDIYPENFYASAEDLEMAVTGLYAICNDMYFYGNDLCYTIGGYEKTSDFSNWQEVDVFNTEGDNGEMVLFWSNSYILINAANEIIENYEEANATEEEKKLNAGQAYFIRAYCYFGLVRKYNELPFYLTSEDCTSDMELTGPEGIYAQIISDLEIAEEYLPDSWTGDEDAKREGVSWTNGAAKSLLAYVYLCMAGYPVNDAEKYALAASKAKEVIDGADTWGYALMGDIADLYSADYNYENRACDEVVLAFYNDNEWGCPKCGCPAEYGGWECFMPEIEYFENYPEGPRKDAIFMWEFPTADGDTIHYTELSSGHPWYKQFWDGKIDWDAPWDGFNWKNSRPQVALTHANTLLVFAEAQAMSSSADADAYDAINQVRNRAGLPDLTEGLSNEAFRDSVVQERAWEFCGSYFLIDPWYDILRLDRIDEIAGKRDESENQFVNTPTKDDYWAPYPSIDDMNPNLSN